MVISLGAEVLRGSLDDLESLREGAAACEGVVHLGYNHDFSQMAEAAQTDLAAIEALGEALVDTGRPFVVASGVLGLATGRIATELDVPESDLPAIRESLVCTVIGRSRGSLVKCAFRADCPRRR